MGLGTHESKVCVVVQVLYRLLVLPLVELGLFSIGSELFSLLVTGMESGSIVLV